MPKLNDLLSGKKKEEEIKEDISNSESTEEKRRNSFTMEELKISWDAFLEEEIVKSNDLVLVTLKKNISIANETEVHLALANHIEIDGLEKVKVELVGFLRKDLKNDFIDVIADVNEDKVEKKAYTNSDKFEKMIEKQPILKDLKERLGLDPDH